MKNSGKILSGLRGLGPPYCLSRIFARALPRAQSGIADLMSIDADEGKEDARTRRQRGGCRRRQGGRRDGLEFH